MGNPRRNAAADTSATEVERFVFARERSAAAGVSIIEITEVIAASSTSRKNTNVSSVPYRLLPNIFGTASNRREGPEPGSMPYTAAAGSIAMAASTAESVSKKGMSQDWEKRLPPRC